MDVGSHDRAPADPLTGQGEHVLSERYEEEGLLLHHFALPESDTELVFRSPRIYVWTRSERPWQPNIVESLQDHLMVIPVREQKSTPFQRVLGSRIPPEHPLAISAIIVCDSARDQSVVPHTTNGQRLAFR